MLSYWEKSSFINYDYIIVGGGIVGLSTACSLKETEPKSTVLVLERGIFPSGASTRNAGFACFGSLTELLEDIDTIGEERCLALVDERWSGLRRLRDRLGDDKLEYLNYGGYELIGENELSALEKISPLNNLLKPLFNKDVFERKDELIKDFGFSGNRTNALVANTFEGQLHTGKMMKSLIDYSKELGVDIITGAEVIEINDGTEVEVLVNHKTLDSQVSFRSHKVAVCTNAFSKKLFPKLEMIPGRGIVLVTQPIEGLRFRGTFQFDKGYFYFRNHGKRVIFGGGRNIAYEAETTDKFLLNEDILNVLHDHLKEIILPDNDFKIDQTWSGIMSFGKNKEPILSRMSDNVVAGVRLGGMGVAIGSRMGDQVAGMLIN